MLEVFPQALMSRLSLGAEDGVLFMNWDGHTSGYHAIWGLTSGKMLSAGDGAATRSLFNGSLGGIDLFQNDTQAGDVDSVAFVPAGGFGIANDTLMFFIDSYVRSVDVITMTVSQTSVASLGIPLPGGGYLSSNITAAAFVATGDWGPTATDPRDMTVVVSGGQAWLYCDACGSDGGWGWAGPYTAPEELFGPDINSYVTSFANVDALGVWRDPAYGGVLAMTTSSGLFLYTDLTSDYGTWHSMSLAGFACQQ